MDHREHALAGVMAELAAERANTMAKTAEKLAREATALRTASDRGRALLRTANALWELVVHREACGVSVDLNELALEYELPRDVLACMGPHRVDDDVR